MAEETLQQETTETETAETQQEEQATTETEEQASEQETERGEAEGQQREESQSQRTARRPKDSDSRFRQLANENKQLRQRLEAHTRVEDTELEGPGPEPDQGAFDTYKEYEAARREWDKKDREFAIQSAIRADRKQRDEKLRQQTAEEQRKSFEESWAKREAATKKRNPKFDTKAAIGKVQPTDAMKTFIAESDMGADMLDHLASNPEDAETIRELSPLRQIIELGNLEARLAEKIKGVGTGRREIKPPSTVQGTGAARPQRSASDILYGTK